MENTMNTSDTVDRTENVDFEEVKEEKLDPARREAHLENIWLCHMTHIWISTLSQIDQLGKDLGVLSIQSQERQEKSDDN